MTNVRERGLEVLGELLGQPAADAAAAQAAGAPGAMLVGIGVDAVFGTIWNDETIDRRSRSLVTLGALIALGGGHELDQHFRIALQNGLTPKELEAVVTQTFPYVGFPKSGPALGQLVGILKEKGRLEELTNPPKA